MLGEVAPQGGLATESGNQTHQGTTLTSLILREINHTLAEHQIQVNVLTITSMVAGHRGQKRTCQILLNMSEDMDQKAKQNAQRHVSTTRQKSWKVTEFEGQATLDLAIDIEFRSKINAIKASVLDFAPCMYVYFTIESSVSPTCVVKLEGTKERGVYEPGSEARTRLTSMVARKFAIN